MIAVAIGGVAAGAPAPPGAMRVFVSTILVLQLVLALGASLSGGPRSLAPNLLAIPVLMVAARFSNRGLVVGAPIALCSCSPSRWASNPCSVVAHPASLRWLPDAHVLCVAVYISPLVASDVRHRADSTLDQLTGLLNRRALEPRFAEIAEQAALTEQPVSVVMVDLDHFKSINDEHGHGVGDAVLRAWPRDRPPCASWRCSLASAARSSCCCSPARRRTTRRGSPAPARASRSWGPQGCGSHVLVGLSAGRGERIARTVWSPTPTRALYPAKRGGRNRVECRPGAGVAVA